MKPANTYWPASAWPQPLTLSELAETERAAGNAEAARRSYLQALDANPDDHWCRGHLAQLEHDQGNTDRAIELYEQILKAEPKAPWRMRTRPDSDLPGS